MRAICKTRLFVLVLVLCTVFSSLMPIFTLHHASAQSAQSDFVLQVSPSPLVETINPGEPKTLELKIRNNGSQTENLKIVPRSFSLDSGSNQIKLGDSEPGDIKDWIIFEHPTFTIAPGQWFTERIIINTPKSAGFSYYFALLVSRKNSEQPTPGKQAIQGSVAVFTLLNVNRPDAKRELEVANFGSAKRVYEFLPATFNVTIKNTGNTIIQPYGNIFIQRSGKSKSPTTVLRVNETRGYILPNTTRTLSTNWTSGFPVYVETKVAENVSAKKTLQWDWGKLTNLRMGRYTAKLVGAYNDGQRDIPMEAVLTFWVIPWRLIIAFIVLLVILVVGIWTIAKKGFKLIRRKKHGPRNFGKS